MIVKSLRHLLVISLIASAASFNTFAAQTFSPEQQKQIDSMIHDYLLNHPEILIQMSQKLQQQHMQEIATIEQHAQKVIPTLTKPLFYDSTSPIAGNPQGNITLVEFFDYQCPHCKEMTATIDNLIKKDPNLKVVYKEFPIFGRSSELAAQAALAANKQGKYLAFHDALMNADSNIDEKFILELAKNQGLNVEKLQKDMKDPAIMAEIKQNQSMAKQLKLLGTPAFVIGNTQNPQHIAALLIPGTTSEQILQMLIQKVQASAA
jgi:protein-disulfide isomerase